MAKLTIYTTGKLTANRADRTLTGMLLPYGEEGRTNLGRLTVPRGILTAAAPSLPINTEHDETAIVGTFTHEDTDTGIRLVATMFPGPAGDKALTEAENGTRAMFSAEVEPIVVRDGVAVSGVLTAAALVERAAFPSAKLAAADATTPDMGEDDPEEDPPTDPPADQPDGEVVEETTTNRTEQYRAPDGTVVTVQSTSATTVTEQEPNTVPNPATLQASELAPAQKLKASRASIVEMLTNYNRTRDAKLLAALSDIIPANTLGIEQPQFVGELWTGRAYTRRIVPMFNHADLTSFKVAGWRWVTKPAVGLYAGDKADIPSGAVSTEAVEIDAQRIAGGHDIDRKYRDFSMASFWESYFAAMTESYAKVSDAYALAQVQAAAPYVAPGAVPAGVPTGLVYIVDAIIAVLNATDTVPDSAVVSTDLWRDIVLTRNEDSLAYLDAAVGLEEGTLAQRRFTLKPSAALAADTALVSCKSAATVHELGGEAPIRVEALDIAKGGVDEGVFGYIAVNIHDEDGLALVSGSQPVGLG